MRRPPSSAHARALSTRSTLPGVLTLMVGCASHGDPRAEDVAPVDRSPVDDVAADASTGLTADATLAGFPGASADSDDDEIDAIVHGAHASCFRFDEAQPLHASYGPATLSYWDPDSTDWGREKTEFGTPASFGLPELPGGQARVIRVPKLGSREGYRLQHGATPNGYFAGDSQVSRYTLVFDVYYPKSEGGTFRSLVQTQAKNDNDADFFVEDAYAGGIGINGLYHGSLLPGRWHRITMVVRAADGEGSMQKYIDGTFVGGQGTTGSGLDARWALDPELLLFADDNGETGEIYMSSMLFIGEALLMDEVARLGGPTAEGACAQGAPGPAWPLKLGRRVDAIAHRGDSCCVPENTLTAIDQAFAKGADHIEIDIRLSRDGKAVLMHDESLRRTTNGSGNVQDQAVAELKLLDAGSYFHPRFAGEPVPTLTEAIRTAAGRGRLYLDIKVSGMGPAIQEAILEAGATADAVWPWAHDRHQVDYYRSTIADADILYGSKGTGDAFFDDLKASQVFGFSIHWANLTPEFANAARDKGMYVEVFTILDRDRMGWAVEQGADAMETDYPAILKEMLP